MRPAHLLESNRVITAVAPAISAGLVERNCANAHRFASVVTFARRTERATTQASLGHRANPPRQHPQRERVGLAAREAHRGRTEHQTGNPVGAPHRDQLRDECAHRVTDRHELLHVECIGERDGVVGAVLETEVR